MAIQSMKLEELVRVVVDPRREGELHDRMCDLREQRFTPALAECVHARSREEAIERGVQGLAGIFPLIFRHRDPRSGEAGHGLGHWVRDNCHAMWLATEGEHDPKAIVPGIIAGTLHDVGTLFVDRYADRTRAVRHAEVGALVVRAAALESGVLTEDEADIVVWAIAAHTHHLKPADVTCADGVVRKVEPFRDMADGAPIMPIWLPRMADRLDCNGPCFPCRHYLTLCRDHEDCQTAGFYKVSFAAHMRPILRTSDEIRADGRAIASNFSFIQQ